MHRERQFNGPLEGETSRTGGRGEEHGRAVMADTKEAVLVEEKDIAERLSVE